MKNKLKICVDMDGVLANFTQNAVLMANTLWNLELTYDSITEPQIGKLIINELYKRAKKDYDLSGFEDNIYKKLCPKGFFFYLDPYPNAIKAVKNLYEAGHEIIFLTKPLEWKYSSSEKIAWLDKYFGDIKYSIIMVSDMSSKYMIQCDCLIDDDPRALVKLPPYHGICIARPWNKEFREKMYEGIVVDSMEAAANWLLENQEFMSLPDRGGIDAPKSNKS